MKAYFHSDLASVRDVLDLFRERNQTFGDQALKAVADGNADHTVVACLLGYSDPLPDPTFCNLLAVELAAKTHFRAISGQIKDTHKSCALVVISDQRFDSSSIRPIVDHAFHRKLVRGALKKVSGDFIAVTRARYLADVPHPDGGYVVACDMVATIWGDDLPGKLSELRERSSKLFQARPNAPAAIRTRMLKSPRDLVAACAAMWELESPPSVRAGEKIANKTKFDLTMRRMQLLSMTPIGPKTVLASGEGAAILRGIKETAEARVRQASALGKPPIHRDEITHFWAEDMARRKDTRSLPRIWLR